MAVACPEVLDPRVRRTRQLLHGALAELLTKKDFDSISVQDIAEAATVNRATFYAHYPDKFALLQCMVADRFHHLLTDRAIHFERCHSALKAIALGVCDYLASAPSGPCPEKTEPSMESAVIGVVRLMILQGLSQHPVQRQASAEMVAAAVSWAIYGAAKEWLSTKERCSPEQIADTVVELISPMLSFAPEQTTSNTRPGSER